MSVGPDHVALLNRRLEDALAEVRRLEVIVIERAALLHREKKRADKAEQEACQLKLALESAQAMVRALRSGEEMPF